jgi:hypothetical protein
MLLLMFRVVSGVGRRDYAIGETYVEYGVGSNVVALQPPRSVATLQAVDPALPQFLR